MAARTILHVRPCCRVNTFRHTLGQICILCCHCIYCCKYPSKICSVLLQQVLQVGAASCGGPQSQHTHSTSFICRVQVLSARFAGTQQTHFEELPASLQSPHGTTHRSDTGTCSQSGSCCVAFHAHGFFTWDTHGESPHVLYHSGPVFFFGGVETVCKNAQSLYSRQANPTEMRAQQPVSREGQTGTRVSQDNRQLHTTSCRFDLCLTEVAHRATVQQPTLARRKPCVL